MGKFIGVQKEVENRYGRKVMITDASATREALEKVFKENKIEKVAGKYSQEDNKLYPFQVKVISKNYYDEDVQFRVYFLNDRGPKSFVQSNKQGEIDLEKLIAKATEAFSDYQRAGDSYRASRLTEQNNAKLAEQLNKKLEGTKFRIITSYGNMSVASIYTTKDELVDLVDFLVENFKS